MFLLGLIDFWYFLSVLKLDVFLNEIVVFINGIVYCVDMVSDRLIDL